MIEARGLTKRYGSTLAVDQLSFEIRPGVVTGFLGPNGAGKTTTMRIILGLDNPTGGSVTVNGRSYQRSPAPMQEIGALLDAKAVTGNRSAYNHLLWLAQAGGIPRRKIDEVLDTVGLTDVAGRRVGGFSLGMYQRLGIAAALLGDPGILLFDEPVNGLDPEGIIWIRTLMKRLASEGRTIFVSSHLMSEMGETADHVLVIGRGRLIADMSVSDLTQRSSSSHVKVISPQKEELAPLLTSQGATVRNGADGALLVTGMDATHISDIAATNNVRLHELSTQRASLEAAFLELTRDSTEFQTGAAGQADASDVAETVRALTDERTN
ncbi:MAG: ATP-binding cassette domain-containing protein [Dehalococcoidia bacterium]